MRGTRAKRIRSKIMVHDEFVFFKRNKKYKVPEVRGKIVSTLYLQGPLRLYRTMKKAFRNPDMALPIY